MHPLPSLSPEDVVRIQLTALQHNDEPTKDAGIRAAFEFASPGNRAVTGPVERFITMVKNPLYAPLLNFYNALYAEVRQEEYEAVLQVILSARYGMYVFYVFTLERQQYDPYAGCWMTSGVAHPQTLYLN